METLFIPTEEDFRRWIREELMSVLGSLNHQASTSEHERFVKRKDIAKELDISLVTLTSWVKHGLPAHKQGNKVYFLKSEVIDYIKEKKKYSFKFKTFTNQ